MILYRACAAREQGGRALKDANDPHLSLRVSDLVSITTPLLSQAWLTCNYPLGSHSIHRLQRYGFKCMENQQLRLLSAWSFVGLNTHTHTQTLLHTHGHPRHLHSCVSLSRRQVERRSVTALLRSADKSSD